jgi:HEAT repeat protein
MDDFERLVEALEVFSTYAQGWERLVGESSLGDGEDLLLRGLRRAGARAAAGDTGVLEVAERCRGLVASTEFANRVRREPRLEETNRERVVRNICGLVTTALQAVAWHLAPEQCDELEVDARDALAGDAATAHEWATWWRAGHQPDGLRVPVLGYHALLRGFLADLTLRRVAGAGPLVEHPHSALVPVGETLLATLERAWARIAPQAAADSDPWHVSWELQLRGRAPTEAWSFDGPSLGAAASVAVELLTTGRLHDPGVVVAALVDADGDSLVPAGALREKLEAAAAWNTHAEKRTALHTAVVAPDSDLGLGGDGIDVVSCRSVAHAADVAAGTVSAVQDYLRALAGDVHRPASAPYADGRTPAELFVVSRSVVAVGAAASATSSTTEGLYGADSVLGPREPWVDVADGGPRRILLSAEPGAGKTLLLQNEAARRAAVALEILERDGVSLAALPLPIPVTLTDLLGAELSLAPDIEAAVERELDRLAAPAALRPLSRRVAAALQRDSRLRNAAAFVAAHLAEPTAVLLIDGLNAVDTRTADAVNVLAAVAATPSTVIATARPGADTASLGLRLVEYRLALLVPSEVQAIVATYPAPVAAETAAALRASPRLRRIARNPFMLTLVCWTAARGATPSRDAGLRLPAHTRVSVYERVVRDLVGLMEYGVDEQRAEAWLPLLRRLMLELALAARLQAPIPTAWLLEAIRSADDRPPVAGVDARGLREMSSTQQAVLLLEELAERRLLLPSGDRSAYALPHPTFGEYLAATELAARLGLGGDATTELLDHLARKAWDPRWEEILVFLSGLLGESGAAGEPLLASLLARLADPAADDLHRHRLAVAARCCAELGSEAAERTARMTESTATAVVDVVWQHRLARTETLTAHLERALGELVGAEATRKASAVADRVVARGARSGGGHRRVLAALLGSLERVSGAGSFTDRLLALARDPDAYVAENAVAALGSGFEEPAQDELDVLRDAARASDPGVRAAAAIAFGDAVGRGGASGLEEAELRRLLNDPSWAVVLAAVRGLRNDGAEDAGSLAADLVETVASGAEAARSAATVLAHVPVAALAASERLEALLDDADTDVRTAALRALAPVAGLGASPSLAHRLADALGDTDPEVRAAAAETLGAATVAGHAEEAAEALLSLAYDDDWRVRYAASQAIAALVARGSDAAALIALLDDDSQRVAAGAARALAAQGGRLQSPRVETSVRRLAFGRTSEVRPAAVLALASFAGTSPAVVDELLELTDDDDVAVRETAAAAAGRLAELEALDPVIRRLYELLREPAVRSAAAESLAALMSAGVRVFGSADEPRAEHVDALAKSDLHGSATGAYMLS